MVVAVITRNTTAKSNSNKRDNFGHAGSIYAACYLVRLLAAIQ